MFNLNIPDASSYLGIEGAGGGLCSTPRTPELLNTLFAMTNPLDVAFTALTQDQMNFNIDSKQVSILGLLFFTSFYFVFFFVVFDNGLGLVVQG